MNEKIGWDAIIGDVFGFNLRALRTLIESFKSPEKIFHAAGSKNWQDRFTPSFRLWFSLLAITFLLKFFWAGTDSGAFEMTAAAYEASGTLPDQITPEMAAKEYIGWTYGYMPVFAAICLFLLAAVYRAWGEPTSYPLRVRKTFVTVIPSAFIGIFAVTALGFVSGKNFFTAIAIIYLASLCFDAVTAYRGAFPGFSKSGRVWRSLLLAFAILVSGVLASTFANFAASATIYFKYVVLV